ncbi:hypothetical protein AKJ16_DCAP08526 [Drosera capensis]
MRAAKEPERERKMMISLSHGVEEIAMLVDSFLVYHDISGMYSGDDVKNFQQCWMDGRTTFSFLQMICSPHSAVYWSLNSELQAIGGREHRYITNSAFFIHFRAPEPELEDEARNLHCSSSEV